MLTNEIVNDIDCDLRQSVVDSVNSGRMSQQEANIIYNELATGLNEILARFDRQYGHLNINRDDVSAYCVSTVSSLLNSLRGRYNSGYVNQSPINRGYQQPNTAPINTGINGFVQNNSLFGRLNNNTPLSERTRDAQGAANASQNARNIDQERRAGNLNAGKTEILDVDISNKKVTQVNNVTYIGVDAKAEEIPTVELSTGENNGNPSLDDTLMYQITHAYTLTQNNVSRTRIVHVTLKKPVYTTEEAIGLIKNTRPDLFSADQYCVALTYYKLTGYGLPGSGDIILNKGNRFKNITDDTNSISQFTDRYEPALKELPNSLRDVVNKIYFTRLNLISEYCLWSSKNPTMYISINNWNRMGLFNTIQDISNQSLKERLIDYINEMKSIYGTLYEKAVFDIAKAAFNQVLCGDNGFIDIRKDHKEYVVNMPNVYMSVDNRYYLRDLFIMPNEDQVKMLGLVARNYLLHQAERTMIITNMRLNTSINNGINIIVNRISELLNCLYEIVQKVNRTDLLVGYYQNKSIKPTDLARIGMGLHNVNENGIMKIRRVQI